MKHVVLYSTTTCEYCWQVRQYLQEKKVAFVEIDTDTSADAVKEVKQLAGDLVVPVTVVVEDKKKEAVVGFNRQKLDKLLG